MAGLAGRPDALNLVSIYAAIEGSSPDAVLARFAGQGFGAFKPAMAELVVETLGPIRQRFVELKEDRESLDAILARGAAHARDIGIPTLKAAYNALGLIRG
jgi:tryptophanyl-tRNA synthetase